MTETQGLQSLTICTVWHLTEKSVTPELDLKELHHPPLFVTPAVLPL